MNKLQNSGKTFIGVKTHQLWIKKFFQERKIGTTGFKAQLYLLGQYAFKPLLSALLNWFNLVYGPCMQGTFDLCLDKPGRN